MFSRSARGNFDILGAPSVHPQPSLKPGKYGNGSADESGGTENAISQSTIDVKIVRKLIII